jgi:hypothetical protein
MVTKVFMLVVNADEKSSILKKRVNVARCPVEGRFDANSLA